MSREYIVKSGGIEGLWKVFCLQQQGHRAKLYEEPTESASSYVIHPALKHLLGPDFIAEVPLTYHYGIDMGWPHGGPLLWENPVPSIAVRLGYLVPGDLLGLQDPDPLLLSSCWLSAYLAGTLTYDSWRPSCSRSYSFQGDPLDLASSSYGYEVKSGDLESYLREKIRWEDSLSSQAQEVRLPPPPPWKELRLWQLASSKEPFEKAWLAYRDLSTKLSTSVKNEPMDLIRLSPPPGLPADAWFALQYAYRALPEGLELDRKLQEQAFLTMQQIQSL